MAEKIDYIVNHVRQWDKLSDESDDDFRGFEPFVSPKSKITATEKKEAIRQNLLAYISVPAGRQLLSALDVKKFEFVDTPDTWKNDEDGAGGVFKSNSAAVFADFEDVSLCQHSIMNWYMHCKLKVIVILVKENCVKLKRIYIISNLYMKQFNTV